MKIPEEIRKQITKRLLIVAKIDKPQHLIKAKEAIRTCFPGFRSVEKTQLKNLKSIQSGTATYKRACQEIFELLRE